MRLVLFLLLFCGTAVYVMSAPGDVTIKKEKGSLLEKVESITARQFGKDTDLYGAPTMEQFKGWSRLVAAVLAGRMNAAEVELKKLGTTHEIVLFTDLSTATEYVVLEEKALKLGWGFYAFNLKSKTPLAIHVTHPISDARTEIEGMDAFLQTKAAAFLMAGSHRAANKKQLVCRAPDESDPDGSIFLEADVAHNGATIFQATHEEMLTARPKTTSVQIHGMAERPICPSVFISSGTRTASTSSKRLLSCLTRQKVEASVFEGDVKGCPLGAQTNVQGRFANGLKAEPCGKSLPAAPEPGSFIHIEQEPSIRRDKASWQPVINALKCAFPAP